MLSQVLTLGSITISNFLVGSFFHLLSAFVASVGLLLCLRHICQYNHQSDGMGLTCRSNLADQHDQKYHMPEESGTPGPVHVKALFIYPIKSCKPIELRRSAFTRTGFVYDRCFVFATREDRPQSDRSTEWRFISQRTKPRLSLIETELRVSDGADVQSASKKRSGGCLIVQFPDPDRETSRLIDCMISAVRTGTWHAKPKVRFAVPLTPSISNREELGITMKHVGIHDRTTQGLDFGQIPSFSAALPKLKRFLGYPPHQHLTLLRCTPESLTRTTKNLAPLEYIGSPALHGYTDQQPLNINSLSSIHAVSKLLPPENQPLNALRFRANIYIAGAPAFAEERWKRFRILRKASSNPQNTPVPILSVVCRTSRCTMPNVDPDIGIFSHEHGPAHKKRGKPQPSTALVEYRMVENGNKAALGYLGMHCVPEKSSFDNDPDTNAESFIEVGDTLEIIKVGSHTYGLTGNDY